MNNDRRDLLAAAFALGTLDGEERQEAQELMAEDSEFARLVSEWEQRLAPLAEVLPPRQPSKQLWERIEATLSKTVPRSASEFELPVTPRSHLASLQRSLASWRLAAIGASLAAIAIALFAFGALKLPWQQVAPDDQYVAMLMDDAGEYGFVITVASSKQKMMVRNLNVEPPPSMCHELWLIKPDGSVPSTLGILTRDTPSTIDLGGRITDTDLKTGVKLAISVEPMEGALSGEKMGPIVYSGELIKQMP